MSVSVRTFAAFFDLRALEAATAMAVLAVMGIYISRRIIRDGHNIAATTGVVAVFVATLWGVRDLKQRQEHNATHQR